MQRDATNPIQRSLAFALACLASLLIAGCGGGGGGGSGSNGSSSAPGKATLRFMQAGALLGTSQFTVQGTTTSVAFRELSAGVSVDAGTVTISATAPGTQVTPISSSLTISINEGDTGIVVLNQRETESPRLVLAGTLGTGTGNSTVSYANFTPFQPILDIYVLTGGQTLEAALPVATGLRTNEITPAVQVSGQYQIVATTPGRKDRIVYQSVPQTAVAGSPTIFLGAQWTAESLQPQPIAVSRSGAAVVDDPRPVVHLLQSYQFTYDRLIRLFVDCDQPVVEVPYLGVMSPKYRVTPGTRSISPACTPLGPGTGPTGTLDTVFLAEQGKRYIQPYRPSLIDPRSLEIQAIGWVAPFVTTDYPIPANKARVRIVARNSLRPGDIYVNGTLLEANVEIKELVVDVNPGNFSITQLQPGIGASEGGEAFTVLAGHYYYIEIGHFATAEELISLIYPEILAGRPVQRIFLVNEDD